MARQLVKHVRVLFAIIFLLLPSPAELSLQRTAEQGVPPVESLQEDSATQLLAARQAFRRAAPCPQPWMDTTGEDTSEQSCPANATGPAMDCSDIWLVARKHRAEESHEWVQAPTRYLPEYRSPCWAQNGTFFCLPSFYVLGTMKSGTSELFGKIVLHPDVVASLPSAMQQHRLTAKVRKEPHWWNTRRWHKRPSGECEMTHSLRGYMTLLQDDINFIRKNPKTITGEASVSLLNGGHSPQPALPQLLQAIWPHTRYFVILRDPVARAYSQYNYRSNNEGASGFHKAVQHDIDHLQRCLNNRTSQQLMAASTASPAPCLNTLLGEGLYAVRLWPWLRDLPKNALLVVGFAELVSDQQSVLQRVYAHLSLDTEQLTDSDWHTIVSNTKHRNTVGKQPMLPETRELLAAFYAPHNEALAELLRDTNPGITDSWTQ